MVQVFFIEQSYANKDPQVRVRKKFSKDGKIKEYIHGVKYKLQPDVKE